MLIQNTSISFFLLFSFVDAKLFVVSESETAVQTESLLDCLISGADSVTDSKYTEAQPEMQHDMKLSLISESEHTDTVTETDTPSVELTVSERLSARLDTATDAALAAVTDDDDDDDGNNDGDDDEQKTYSRQPMMAAEPWPSHTDEFGILTFSTDDVWVCFIDPAAAADDDDE